MASIIEDYLREVGASLRVDAARKRQIVDELRSHLREKVADLEREDPLRPRADVERAVLAEMGSPRELALAYEPDGAVLRNRTGDVILRMGAAAGRGVGRVLKWMAIAVAALLVVALAFGVWLFYEVKPYALAMAEESEPLYEFDQACAGTPCNGALPADTFHVGNNTTALRFVLSLSHAYNYDEDVRVGNGTVQVVVRDPTGATRLDRTFNMTNASHLDTEATWAAVPGDWTVSVTLTAFQGAIEAEAYPRHDGVPPLP